MDFYKQISKLKQLERNGWKKFKIDGRLESVAEHTMSAILLAIYEIKHQKIDLDELKVIKMLAFHDLAESEVGDITPYDNISKQDKFNREYAFIKKFSKEINMPEIETLWLEFEQGKTPEAQFVYNIDKFDAVEQARIYSCQTKNSEIADEFDSRYKHIVNQFKKS